MILGEQCNELGDVWKVICSVENHMLAAFFHCVAGEQIINLGQILHFFGMPPEHCVIIILFQEAKNYADTTIWFHDNLSGRRSKTLLFPVLFIILRLLSFPLLSDLKSIMSSILGQA